MDNKKRKSPNAYFILFTIIVVVAILTWIIPAGSYAVNEAGQAIPGSFKYLESNNPQGIWNILMSPIVGMIGNKNISGAIGISLFVMLFGSFLEMMDRTNALNIYLKRVAIKNKNNRNLLIVILVLIMGAMGTIEGAYEEGFVYLLMFMPIILGIGLDTVVTAKIVILGTQAGCISSIINPFATGIASEIAGINPGEGIVLRIIMFFVLMAFVSLYICYYANKVYSNPEKSMQFYRREEDIKEFSSKDEDLSMTKEQKYSLIVFVALFIIMIIALVPWTMLNPNWVFFDKLNEFLVSIPYLGAVIGKSMIPLGQWYFNEVSMLLLVFTVIVGKIMKYDIDTIVNVIIKGAAGLVGTAFIVPLARGIQVIMNDGQITHTILHMGETSLSSLNPVLFLVVSLLFYFLIALFIPSSSGLAAATMAIMASLAQFANVPKYLMIIAYLCALGIAKMITPTSVVLMTCTSAAHINYIDWVKHIWKFLIALFVLCCLFLILGVYLKI